MRDDLGPLPSAKTGRAVVRVDTSAASRGIDDLGKSLAVFGGVLSTQADKAQEFDTERRFGEFKFEREKDLDQAMRTMEPGRAQHFQNDWNTGYMESARQFFETVPESLKPKYDAKLFGAEQDLYGAAQTFAYGEQKRFSINALNEHRDRLALSGDLPRARADYEELLNVNPYLTPIEKDEVRRKGLSELEEQNIEWRIRRGDDLEAIIKDLETGGEPPPSPVKRSAIERHEGGMATVRSGSGARFRVAGDYADRFAGAIADLEAAGVDINGDQSGGYANRNIKDPRTGRDTGVRSKHADGAAIDVNWHENARGTQGKIDPELARSIAEKWGLVWGGDWEGKKRDPMHFEVDRAAKPKAEYSESADSAPVVGRSLTQYAGMSQPSDTTGAVLPQSPYASLSPQRRSALVYKAKTALSAKTQQGVNDDIERIRKTGEVPMAPDGSTSLTRAKSLLTKNQIDALDLKWKEAEMEYQAVSPLPEMTEQEALAHLAGLIPSAETAGQSYDSAVKVEKKATDAWKKIKELREKDPAKAVAESPEVMKVESDIAAAQGQSEDMQTVPGLTVAGVEINPITVNTMRIEARKSAQKRLGLADWEIKPITRAEAKELLAMPDPSAIDDPGTYYDGLVAAANRADDLYGPEYAYEALKAAISFTRRDKEEKEISSGVLASMARGEPVSPADLNRMSTAQEIESAARAFEPLGPGFAPQTPDYSRPGLMQNAPGQALIPFGPPKPKSKKASEAQINWLMQDPQKRQGVFDSEFGSGYAAKVIGKVSKSNGGDGDGPSP